MQSVVETFSDITNGIKHEVMHDKGIKYAIYSTTMNISDEEIDRLIKAFNDTNGEPLKIVCEMGKEKLVTFEGTVFFVYDSHCSVHIIGENNNQYVLPFSIIETVLSNSGEIMYQKGMHK